MDLTIAAIQVSRPHRMLVILRRPDPGGPSAGAFTAAQPEHGRRTSRCAVVALLDAIECR
jgi:hypothetical protein